ncbi:MAG: GAF domain-containing protein [Candidatus Latescibacteria bacterium]|nr:GAF domain-containing protein [Candidatus Latescibacterota bacterium]NIM22047.1 GAF domain-containing protein [Candidatus Latescibacterota bacterium]NIM66066.1 GAF domain-containing protein [Candidatus Latescibacterota bacterium]NIO02474.1 GAF domain-containing protein [Candidatus Latescibacterota bacterium]NIO29385.1 GAF domain-containing protein [Candidatus Latescibacterota bacterium]
MELPPGYKPDFESFKDLLLEMAQERDLDAILKLAVSRLAARPHMGLARIWLVKSGDICVRCPMRTECPDQTLCLHLVASAGRPFAEASANWSRLNGEFSRFPLGVRKIGRIGASGVPVHIEDVGRDIGWMAKPDWLKKEGIRSFSGQPLVYKGETIGVIAVFSRIKLLEEGLFWLRMIADHLAAAIANARAFEEVDRLRRKLELQNAYLQEEMLELQAYGNIVGKSPALKNVLRQIEMVSPTDAGVLIVGESGTGKELVAREIHRNSTRSAKPMIKVNCATIPRELYESEFFGHVRGAFNGAVRDRAGRFELAHEGTLFLDQVGEIPLELQGKLLRVLQEGQYERVGDERTRQVDVRIIAATNKNLKKEIQEGRFRKDLYYRLNVFPIEVAPLRHRKEDIPLLAERFLKQATQKLSWPRPRLTQANMLQLRDYDWPGNARELQNIIERAVITSRSRTLRFDFPAGDMPREASLPPIPPPPKDDAPPFVTAAEIRHLEKENLLAVLELTKWKIYGRGGAAELLGMKPTTLFSKIKKMGLKKPG